MITRINLNIQGEVELLYKGKTIFKENNSIAPDAVKVLLMALPNSPVPVNLDTIRVEGDFGSVDTLITDSIYNQVDGSMTFISTIKTSEAIGLITDLSLMSSIINSKLAIKADLEISKSDSVQIEVRWKITIINN